MVYSIMKRILTLNIIFLSLLVQGQINEPLASNTVKVRYDKPISDTTPVKQFSNSEIKGIDFYVNLNLKTNEIEIQTNYTESYKIQLIDYWAHSVTVYKNITSDYKIDVAEFRERIFIMNITNSKNNKLLTSQVINLKRRSY